MLTFPAGEKGFVGGAADTTTGLTDLGAREYQPATGSFISTDPLLDAYDPQDLNPYAYALDNPATKSDPSGALQITNGGGGGGCVGQLQYCQQQTKFTGAYRCTGPTQADVNACVKSTEEANTPRGTTTSYTSSHGPFCPTPTGSCNIGRPIWKGQKIKPGPAHKRVTTGSPPICGQPDPSDVICVPPPSNPISVIIAIGNTLLPMPGSISCAGGDGDPFGDPGEFFGFSFTADTLVLMASGTPKSIASLKPGDKVLATNTKTGKTQPESVTAVMVHRDTDLYDLKIRVTVAPQ